MKCDLCHRFTCVHQERIERLRDALISCLGWLKEEIGESFEQNNDEAANQLRYFEQVIAEGRR